MTVTAIFPVSPPTVDGSHDFLLFLMLCQNFLGEFSTLDLKSAYYQVPLAAEDRAYTAFEADGKLYQYCRLPFGVTNGVSCFQRIIDSVIADNNLKQTFAYLDNITIGGFDKADHDRVLKKFLDAASKINLTSMTRNLLLPLLKLTFLGTAYLRDP